MCEEAGGEGRRNREKSSRKKKYTADRPLLGKWHAADCYVEKEPCSPVSNTLQLQPDMPDRNVSLRGKRPAGKQKVGVGCMRRAASKSSEAQGKDLEEIKTIEGT